IAALIAACVGVLLRRRPVFLCVVAGLTHRVDQLLDIDVGGGLHHGAIGGIVHRSVDPVDFIELLLDASRARGTGHPADVELDLALAAQVELVCGRRCAHEAPASSYPAASTAVATAARSS